MSHLVVQALIVLGATWILLRLTRHYRRSNKPNSIDNLPGPPATSLWKGNFKDLFQPDAWDFHKGIALTYGNAIRIAGPLGQNQLFVFDPKAMHHIIVKEQHIYEEAVHFIAGNTAVFGKGLLSTLGDHHRKQRKMLNPVFSIAHMRGVVPIFYEVAFKLRDTLLRKVSNGPQEIDMQQWLTRTALELIGQSGLGYSFDTLAEDGKQHPFCDAAKMLVRLVGKTLFPRQYLYPLVYKIGSPRFQRFVVGILPWKALHDLRDVTDVLHKTSVEIFEAKKRAIQAGDEALAKEVGKGKDIISVLMAANMNASEEDRLPDEEVIGQMSTLTFAATDTTSSALARILWLLCVHPQVQQKLRQEILEAREQSGDLDYDRLSALPYLDAVCRETLRLYPPVGTLMREARKDTVLPLSKPIQGLDGSEITEVIVPENTKIHISLISSNRNPDLWGPDSFEWKPERWLSQLPESVTEAKIPGIYSNLMTFLGGGRACIGFKFSQLEMKTVLCVLLEQFAFELPKDKEIIWKMPGIAKPCLSGDKDMHVQLPLVVSRIQSK